MARVKKPKPQKDGEAKKNINNLIKGVSFSTPSIKENDLAQKGSSESMSKVANKISKSTKRKSKRKMIQRLKNNEKILQAIELLKENITKVYKTPVPTFKSYVANLPKGTSAEELKKTFINVGIIEVESIRIVPGKMKTFGIVIFKTSESLQKALSLNKNLKIGNNKLLIKNYKHKNAAGNPNDDMTKIANETTESEKESTSDAEMEIEEEKGAANSEEKEENLVDNILEEAATVKKRIIVKNLDPSILSDELKAEFEKEGVHVINCKLKNKGCFRKGWLTLASDDDVKKAVGLNNLLTLKGKALTVIGSHRSAKPSKKQQNSKKNKPFSGSKNKNRSRTSPRKKKNNKKKGGKIQTK